MIIKKVTWNQSNARSTASSDKIINNHVVTYYHSEYMKAKGFASKRCESLWFLELKRR